MVSACHRHLLRVDDALVVMIAGIAVVDALLAQSGSVVDDFRVVAVAKAGVVVAD